MNLFKLINLFRKTNGRSPSPNELAMLKRQVSGVGGDNVIQFPGGDKSGIKSLDEFTKSENIYEQAQDLRSFEKEVMDTLYAPTKPDLKVVKPKGEGTLKFEEELNVNLYGDETFEELMQIKKTGKHPRDKAAGGRIGFFAGGAKGLLKILQGKLGKKTVKMADDVDRPKSALDREMFDEANKRFNTKIKDRTSAEIVVPENKMSKTMINEGYDNLEYFDPNALDMYGKPITMDKAFFDNARERVMKQINEQERLMVPRSHRAYRDLQASLRGSKDRLTALNITEEVGGNIKMFDKLRMKNGVKLNATPLSKFDYLKGTSTADNITPKKLKPKTPNKALLKAMDEIGGGTGDMKYDADVLADEYAFQLGLIEEGGDITDIADQMKRMDLYDEAYSALSGQFLKQREMRKLSKPTQTLKSIKEKGTIDISDENVMGDFDTFMREADPEGYADLEQKIELSNFDPSGRKKNAVGGLAHMLGEGPRSMYGDGGGAGMPPVTHDDNVDNIGPGTMNPGSRPRLNVMPQMRPGKYMENKMNQRPMQNLANGGRISFAGGGLSRRAFLKLLGAGTATAAAAKTGILGLLKGKKAATGVKVLSNTTTTMPAWFPDLVDKMMVRGIGKKIDQDLMEYTTKELPNVKMAKSDDGKILLEGQNEYGRPYAIEYEPPGYELLDEATGKSVRTKGDFRATDVVPESGGRPDDVPDFFPEQLDSVDDILSSDARVMEEFATGQKVKNIKQGESSLLQAEQRLDSSLNDIDDFAKGGLAKLLGE